MTAQTYLFKMKHHTKKRAAIEREYVKAKAEIMEEREPSCEGCGTYSGSITFSHRIPRSRRRDLIADKDNIDLMCPSCHEHVEAGRYQELANGEAIMKYIIQMEPELIEIKKLRRDNLVA